MGTRLNAICDSKLEWQPKQHSVQVAPLIYLQLVNLVQGTQHSNLHKVVDLPLAIDCN